MANWDVRAHTVNLPVPRDVASPVTSRNQRTLMAGLLKRAKRSWRRVGRRFRQHAVGSSPAWLRRAAGPPASYLDMLFVDHGIFRIIYGNSHRLSDKAWRAAQPAPYQLRRYAKAGVRTIVNLRGARECGAYYLERRACEQLGMKLVNFQVRSRARADARGAAGSQAAVRRDRIPDDDALQVGRRPRRPDERPLPLPARGRADRRRRRRSCR